MKIRNGFVSNSSSSSFTCEVCGETQSGMDMSRSEAGMVECENGHTFCESHELDGPEISLEEKRKKLFADVEESSYYKTRPREKAVELDTISNYTEDEVNASYDETCENKGRAAQECPICTFTEMHEGLTLKYLLKWAGTSKENVLAELKKKFPLFKDFEKYCNEK